MTEKTINISFGMMTDILLPNVLLMIYIKLIQMILESTQL